MSVHLAFHSAVLRVKQQVLPAGNGLCVELHGHISSLIPGTAAPHVLLLEGWCVGSVGRWMRARSTAVVRHICRDANMYAKEILAV